MVGLYHDEKAADEAQAQFDRLFKSGHALREEDMTEKSLTKKHWQVADLLMEIGAAASKSQARRLLDQGAIKLDGMRLDADEVGITNGSRLQVGKRGFYLLRLK